MEQQGTALVAEQELMSFEDIKKISKTMIRVPHPLLAFRREDHASRDYDPVRQGSGILLAEHVRLGTMHALVGALISVFRRYI